jgi:hypothetical protein
MWLTPYHEDSFFPLPRNLDSKITIFYEQTKGWQLDIAEQTVNISQHSGFAVLSIVFSYFEKIGKYENGYADKYESRPYFKKGFYSVFPELEKQTPIVADELLNLLYDSCRCGLYHGGITESRIQITWATDFPIQFDGIQKIVIINPKLLIADLQRHLQEYVDKLRNPSNTQLRKNLETRFDYNMTQ